MKNMARLVEAMRSCEQTQGLSVLQHGLIVRDRYSEVLSHIRDGHPLRSDWRLPAWIHEPGVLKNLPPKNVMARYHVFHDCGKPAVLTVEGGIRRFPGHAAASEQAYREAGGDDLVARLIGQDMDIHLLKDAGVAEFAARPYASALLLTGLAEIHANAGMFGGLDNDSFKIKWKVIDRRGMAILAKM
jgi:hypothetical protein